MKRILYIHALYSFSEFPDTLSSLGYQVTCFAEKDFDPNNSNELRYPLIQKELMSASYDYVASYLYFPTISNICEALHIPYIAWTYDAPLVSLFDASIYNSCNLIFSFDYEQYAYFKKLNVKNIFYLPMAANTDIIDKLNLYNTDYQQYSHNISFVGGLYEDNLYNQGISLIPDEYQPEIRDYLTTHLCNWDAKRSWPILSSDLTNFLVSKGASLAKCADMPDELFLGILLLSRKLGEMERITILNRLSASFPVDFYTRSKSPYLQNIIVHAPVDYQVTMRKIFHLSKINLNITLPSICSGIPQRVFDIMACGGFVLTNYQPDIERHFKIGEEIETFKDMEECMYKADYYLHHDEARLKIAVNGFQSILQQHNYTQRVTELMEIVQQHSVC